MSEILHAKSDVTGMIFTWCSWSNTISRCSISSTPSKSVRRKPRQDSWRI